MCCPFSDAHSTRVPMGVLGGCAHWDKMCGSLDGWVVVSLQPKSSVSAVQWKNSKCDACPEPSSMFCRLSIFETTHTPKHSTPAVTAWTFVYSPHTIRTRHHHHPYRTHLILDGEMLSVWCVPQKLDDIRVTWSIYFESVIGWTRHFSTSRADEWHRPPHSCSPALECVWLPEQRVGAFSKSCSASPPHQRPQLGAFSRGTNGMALVVVRPTSGGPCWSGTSCFRLGICITNTNTHKPIHRHTNTPRNLRDSTRRVVWILECVRLADISIGCRAERPEVSQDFILSTDNARVLRGDVSFKGLFL